MPLATSRPAASGRTAQAASPVRRPAGRTRFLDVPFQMRQVAVSAGASWDAAKRSWTWRGEGGLPVPLAPFAGQAYSWERFQEDLHDGVEPKPSVPTRDVVLRPHQVECRALVSRVAAADRSGFLNADDVGLGKTMETWAAVRDMDFAETVLVVCPLAAVAMWRRTIEWMGDAGKRVVVINYDRLKRLFETPVTIPTKSRKKSTRKRRVRTQKGVARYGTAQEFDVVVFDESHYLRNLHTARFQLAEKLKQVAEFVVWLSATAGQDPIELAYLSSLLAEATGAKAGDLSDFEKWCKGQGFGVSKGAFGKWSWVGRAKDRTPEQELAAEADLERMRSILFDGPLPAGIRRSPSDIAGWPSVNRILFPVELDPADRVAYESLWQEFRASLGLERRGGADSRNALVLRLRFRQKASLLRTAATLDLGLDLLAQGHQVAVSVEFHETSDVLREAFEREGLGVSVIDGRVGAAEKERARLDFQHGRTTVCLYSVDAAINLHQGECNDVPRSNLIHDLRWSGIKMKQIEGRTHRDGKFSQAYWMVGVDTVEEEIAETVAARLKGIGAMHGDRDTVDDVERLLKRLAG